jgi:DNA repair protein RecN (Recombination protein N)
MLTKLYIENLAVIERAEILFTEGLNVFTGETGAGKSVLVGGLDAALGRRVSRDIVRTGAERAVVSAVFEGVSEEVSAKLSEMGIDAGEEVILTREIFESGKSSGKINGRPATAAMMAEVGALLCDIHGQSDSRILADESLHMPLVDGFGDYKPLLDTYKNDFSELLRTSKRLTEKTAELEKQKADILWHRQLRDNIAAFNIAPDEDEEIDFLFRNMEDAEQIRETAKNALAAVSSDEDGFRGAYQLLFEAEKLLSEYSENEDVKDILSDIETAQVAWESVIPAISDFAESADFDEDKLFKIRSRKELIDDIKKRYGGPEQSLSHALSEAKKSEDALAEIYNADETLRLLRLEKDRLLGAATKTARELSKQRRETAERLSAAIAKELSELDMENVSLKFSFTEGKLTRGGLETARLMFSPNPGEELRPLAKIASGGELSRIMLAIKSVVSGFAGVTMVFDEIDTGVSGRAAAKIGRKLKKIAGGAQVIAVTHLAQIAVCADNHLLIEKRTEGGRTFTAVKPVTGDERVREIARIQVGDNITPLALENAAHQLKAAKL